MNTLALALAPIVAEVMPLEFERHQEFLLAMEQRATHAKLEALARSNNLSAEPRTDGEVRLTNRRRKL